MMAVSDTGMGMDEITKTKIFDPFFTTKEQGKGTGLGLSTCYGIVKQNNGNILVYSEPTHGTTVKIYLPRVEGEYDQILNKLKTTELPGGNETILIVEDEPAVRNMIVRSLRGKGYTIYEASDGKEALDIVEKHEKTLPLILLSLMLSCRIWEGKIWRQN